METLYVDGLFVVAADAELIFQVEEPNGWETGIVFQSQFQLGAGFRNLGFISLSAPSSSATSLTLIRFSQSYYSPTLENIGTLIVSGPSDFVTAVSEENQISVFNSGSITASGGRWVKGINLNYYRPKEDIGLDNSGSLIVAGSSQAIGVYGYGGIYKNSGTISAQVVYSGSSDNFAVGLSLAGNFSVENSGSISAVNLNGGYSSAIFIKSYGSININNSGVLRGQYGVHRPEDSSSSELEKTSISNAGIIEGRVLLGRGADHVINSGQIKGLIELGGGTDIYDGRGGRAVQGVQGAAGNDLFYAGNGPETFLGQEGDDTFMSGRGASVFDGGSGYDVVSYALEAKNVTVSLAETGSQRHSASGFSQFVGIEGLVGSSFGDKLTGDGLENRLNGALGNDRLAGGGGADVLLGGAGLDQLFGDEGDDALYGEAGADTLTGGGGADRFYFIKGDGADVIVDFEVDKDRIKLDQDDGYSAYLSVSQVGADVLLKFSSTDSILVRNVLVSNLLPRVDLLNDQPMTIIGDDQPNLIIGSIANDTLMGGGGDDRIFGGRGDDFLSGGEGIDFIDGGEGNDTLVFDQSASGRPRFVALGSAEGLEIELITNQRETFINIENIEDNSATGDMLYGTSLSNVIKGGRGGDTIGGQDGDDFLFGRDGADLIYGDNGQDVIEGGQGNDELYGGAGADIFRYSGWSNDDRILDYEAKLDVIDFSGSGLSRSQIVLSQSSTYALVTTPFGTIKVRHNKVADLIIKTDDQGVINPPKLDISLATSVIAENAAIGTVVGTLSTSTAGAAKTFSYGLVDQSSEFFAIVGDKVVVKNGLDFEKNRAPQILVKVSDGQGGTRAEIFSFSVSDVDERPFFARSVVKTSSLAENSTIGTGILVGSFSGHDDALGSYSAKLIGPDAAYFELRQDPESLSPDGKAVYYIGPSPDYETRTAFSATVLLDDPLIDQALENTLTFNLAITDVVEAPPPPPPPSGPTEGDDKGAGALMGTALADSLSGLGGSDELYGLEGDDSLSGGLGDDVLIGGAGRDVLDGGAGVDTASYATAKAGLRADLSYPTKSTGDAAGDVFTSIENLIGSDFNDSLGGNNANNILYGGGGDDSLGGLGGGDRLFGGAGNDTLLGQGGTDILDGGAGNDVLNGGLGSRDWFVFSGNWGQDRIVDFERGVDLIDLRGNDLTFAELTVTQQGADVLVSSAEFGASILISNLQAANLAVTDFLF
jgi:Ca2+-binding RTX toxin-like protein